MVKKQTAMNSIKFNDELTRTLSQIAELLDKKGDEYSIENNVFSNFEKAANIQNLYREEIMFNYSMKHFVSIIDMIQSLRGVKYTKTTLPDKDVINEKFNDMIAYLIIMKSSLLDRHR